MKIEIDINGVWYHGSNKKFDILLKGITVSQWKQLVEAFSHQPSILS